MVAEFCGSVLAVTELGPSYKRATVMQASLALIAAGAGIVRWAARGWGRLHAVVLP